jgi:hypothetical protein
MCYANRPSIKDVYSLLSKHKALIVHFSGVPKGAESVQLNGVFKLPQSNLINVNDKYKGTMSGPQISIGLTWSPPALPFDPLDMFRGMSGM